MSGSIDINLQHSNWLFISGFLYVVTWFVNLFPLDELPLPNDIFKTRIINNINIMLPFFAYNIDMFN